MIDQLPRMEMVNLITNGIRYCVSCDQHKSRSLHLIFLKKRLQILNSSTSLTNNNV